MSPSCWEPRWESLLTRRAFLGGAASVAAVAMLPIGTARAAAAALAPTGNGPRRSTFTPLLHATFGMVDDQGRSVATVLSQIADLTPAVAAGETSFTLMFDGPESPPRAQGTYRFTHPAIGALDLFVVPVGRATSVRHYEAIVNTR